MLTLDRYFLACKPLFYSRIITKRRVFYSVTFFWILSGILVAITSPQIYDFIPKMDEAKLFVLSLFTIYCFVLTVIMILNIKTWQTVARRHVSHDIQSLGNRQNGNASKNLEHRAERKRLENERRFSKVILLLLLNLVFFILPQVLIIGIKSVNIWCEFCVTEFEHPNVYLFQVYFFPMFYITTPVLYIVSIPKYRKSCRTLFF
jgi:small-conductance mechanosensitive channel